jgi:hypothetical protein
MGILESVGMKNYIFHPPFALCANREKKVKDIHVYMEPLIDEVI